MKNMQTIQEMMQNDPTIVDVIFDSMDTWEGAGPSHQQQNNQNEAWEKFSDVGLLKDVNLPPIKKASEIDLGRKYPMRALKRITLKHGVSVRLFKYF